MVSRTYSTEGFVLKTNEIGEADKLVILFTRRFGKIVALAKGVRKITSRRAGTLEPATQGIFFFSHGKTWDILTQVQLINSFAAARRHLARVTQVYQLLEVTDLLTRELQAHPEIYDLVITTLTQLNQPGHKRQLLVNNIRHIVANLGFGTPPDSSEAALKHHIETIANRALRTKAILSQ